jgi:hypothetical protein
MRHLHKLVTLSPKQRRVLASALFWMTVVRVGLRIMSFHQMRRWLPNREAQVAQGVDQLCPPIDQIRWAVQASSRYLPGEVKCLPRALTAQVLLRRYGYPCELRIGVTGPSQAAFEAHAWVESQGQIVVGDLPNLQRFVPLL